MDKIIEECDEILVCLTKSGPLNPEEMPPDLIPLKTIIEELKQGINRADVKHRPSLIPIATMIILHTKRNTQHEQPSS